MSSITSVATATRASTPWSRDVRTISVVSIAHGGSHFCQLMVPPLFPWIAPAFGLSNTQLGLLMSVFFVVSGFGQAFAGFIVDRHGPERVLFGGLALLALAALGLGASPSYAALLVFMGVAGLGNCVFHPVDFSILNARVHHTRLGHAYAAHGISGSLGWALAPLFVVGIAAVTSWRLALFGVAAAAVALLAFAVWQRGSLGAPQGSSHGGDEVAAERSPGSAGSPASPASSASSASPGGADAKFAFLRLPAVWACFGFFFIFAAALGGVQSFAPAAASKMHGITAEQVALCLSAYMVSGAAGMVVGGQLLRDPRRTALIAGLGFGFAALVALTIAFGHWPAAWVPVLCGAMGFGSGIAGPSRDLLVKQATPPGATGRVYGVVYSGLDAGLVVAPLLFGMLMDAGLYRAVWIGVAALFALLIVTALNVKRSAAGAHIVT
ncbi:MAG: MFS transporter [Burkholderiales bacterium]|nr:MFS transporter [Burkholderiales bacterium]